MYIIYASSLDELQGSQFDVPHDSNEDRQATDEHEQSINLMQEEESQKKRAMSPACGFMLLFALRKSMGRFTGISQIHMVSIEAYILVWTSWQCRASSEMNGFWNT